MQLESRLQDRNAFCSILCVIAATLAPLLLQPNHAKGDVLAQGELCVLAVGSGINPEIRRTEATGTENEDAASVSFDYGATNSASHLVSIDRARLESSVSGVTRRSSWMNPSAWWSTSFRPARTTQAKPWLPAR